MATLSRTARSSSRRLLQCCPTAAAECSRSVIQRRALASMAAEGSPSTSSSSSWKPPIAPGVEPAYDEALAFLSQHRSEKARDAEQLRKKLPSAAADEAETLKRRIEELEVVAEVNDPAVRWEFENGKMDLSNPVHRYLREMAWRRPSVTSTSPRTARSETSPADAGPLVKLIERCRLMRVVPDVVPFANPTVDLQVSFGEGSGFGDHGGEGGEVLAGVFLDAQATQGKPTIEATAFHTDERKYTLLLVDPDSPEEASATYKTLAHWLIEDIPLSATRTKITEGSGREVLSYIPPHPQRGTPSHRYVTLLLTAVEGEAVQEAQSQDGAATASEESRENFNVAAYMARRSLSVAGIHFWREVWEEGKTAQAVKEIYKSILQQPEPAYANPPKQRFYVNEMGERPSRYFP